MFDAARERTPCAPPLHQNKKDFLPSSGGGAAASSDANPADTGDGADESKDTPEPASAEKGAAAPAGKRTLVGLDDAKAKKLTLEAFQRFAVTNCTYRVGTYYVVLVARCPLW